MSAEENKRERKSWALAITIQVIMFLAFYFLIAWKEPFPPIPTYGIELGFVTDASQPKKAASTQNKPVEEETKEVTEQASEEVENTSQPDNIPALEENFEDFVDENSVVESLDTPIPEPTEALEESNAEDLEEINEDIASEAELPQDMISEENDTGEDDKTVESIPNENPSIDDRAIYGTSLNAGEQGASLQMSGWVWDSRPIPKDKSDEIGRIEFEIKVDADGYIADIIIVSSTLTPSVSRLYQESIEQLTFSKTNEYRSAASSTGKVTFIITTK
jgi:outer membrane biosynthesis protein TonB